MKLSIGALSRASGIPANTIRTWERRYGFPLALRSAGGQRLYAEEAVEQLCLVARALEKGHRPAQLGATSIEDLRALYGTTPSRLPPSPAASEGLDGWLRQVAELDAEGLKSSFQAALATMGQEVFLSQGAGPFLEAVGQGWASGSLQPFQEHFASECLREFLVELWRPKAEANQGPLAVLCTMPAERHGLGLHMVACQAAEAGWRIVFLGVETPLPDIDACARQVGAEAVLVSVSAASNRAQASWDLASLRARLPVVVRLVVGGAGAPEGEWEREFYGPLGYCQALTLQSVVKA